MELYLLHRKRYLQIVINSLSFLKHSARNISVDHVRRTSVWYGGMPVIAMATELSLEIEAKCNKSSRSEFSTFVEFTIIVELEDYVPGLFLQACNF